MRRGQVEYLHWFARIAMMFVAILVVFILIRFFTDREIDDHEAREAAIFSRILLKEYAYEKDGRPYLGTIDYARFTSTQKGTILGSGAAKLTLAIPDRSDTIVYIDETTFERYYALAKVGVIGRQSGNLLEQTVPVTVYESGRTYPATLKIDIVTPNS